MHSLLWKEDGAEEVLRGLYQGNNDHNKAVASPIKASGIHHVALLRIPHVADINETASVPQCQGIWCGFPHVD